MAKRYDFKRTPRKLSVTGEYVLASDYDALAAEQEKTQAELSRAFNALELMGVPKERAKSVDNGIFVLDKRHERQHESDRGRIRELEAALLLRLLSENAQSRH